MLKVLTIGMVSFLYPTIIGNVLADAILSIQLHVDLKVGQEIYVANILEETAIYQLSCKDDEHPLWFRHQSSPGGPNPETRAGFAKLKYS